MTTASTRIKRWITGVLMIGAFLTTLAALAQAETPLGAPALVEASDRLYADRIELQWEAVEGASRYEVIRSTFENYMYVPWGTTTETSFTDRILNASQHYYYKLRACRDGQCGPYSDPVVGTWDIAIPSGISATRGRYPDKIVISWDRVAGATLYYVCRASEENGTFRVLAMVYRTSFEDTGASAGTTHFYRIRALTTSTGSDLSTAASGYRDATLRSIINYRTITE